MTNPYETLGVAKGSEDQEIKEAYKELAKKWHPDRNPDKPNAEEKFKEIKAAYERIKTAQAREEFEQEELARQFGSGNYSGGNYAGGNPFAGGGGFTYSQGGGVDEDILNDLFGQFGMGGFSRGQSRGQSRKREVNESVNVKLDFWDAAAGGERFITLPSGAKLQINIPAGVKHGQKIRLKGQANKINPSSTGDLLLQVEVSPARKAWRDGQDIVVEHDLPVDVAIAGGTTNVATPLGSYQLSVPPYTDSGKKFRLKGKAPKGGDLLVKVNLVLPKNKKEEMINRFSDGAAA